MFLKPFKYIKNIYLNFFYHFNYIFIFLIFTGFLFEILVIKNHYHNGDEVYHKKFSDNIFIGESFSYSKDLIATNRDQSYMDSSLQENVSLGNLELRKMVRWVGLYLDYKLFYNVYSNFGSKVFFFFYVTYFSFFLTLTFYFICKIIGINNDNSDKTNFVITFLIYLLFFFLTIYQYYSPEHSYTIKETLLISIGLYSALKRKIYLFLPIIIFAPLVRESGIIISIFWLIFNKFKIRNLIFPIIASSSLIIFNYDIVEYFFSYGFFISFETQPGQIVFWDFNNYNLNFIRIIFLNFLIYLYILITLYFFKNNFIERNFIFLSLFYLIILIFFGTTSHYSSKFLIAPMIIYLFYKKLIVNNEMKYD